MNAHDALFALVKQLGSQQAVAAKLGISKAYLCDVLHKRRDLSDKLARKIGYTKVVSYQKVKP
ncbi:MAG: hypothetical protein ACKVQA_06985 [Burkholderiales bacterium]